MSEGVTDEQRVAGWRDRYGKVAYGASWLSLNPDAPGLQWEQLPDFTRRYYGDLAEAVIAASVAGESAPRTDPAGGVGREGEGGK